MMAELQGTLVGAVYITDTSGILLSHGGGNAVDFLVPADTYPDPHVTAGQSMVTGKYGNTLDAITGLSRIKKDHIVSVAPTTISIAKGFFNIVSLERSQLYKDFEEMINLMFATMVLCCGFFLLTWRVIKRVRTHSVVTGTMEFRPMKTDDILAHAELSVAGNQDADSKSGAGTGAARGQRTGGGGGKGTGTVQLQEEGEDHGNIASGTVFEHEEDVGLMPCLVWPDVMSSEEYVMALLLYFRCGGGGLGGRHRGVCDSPAPQLSGATTQSRP